MTSTVCVRPTVLRSSYSYMDRSLSRDSNSAGAPLPRIPRRTPPSSRSHSTTPPAGAATTLQNLFTNPSPATFVVQPPTPPPAARSSVTLVCDEHDFSSSGSESCVEVKGRWNKMSRLRRHADILPPEQSTPTPEVFQAKAEGIAWPRRGSPEPESYNTTPRQWLARSAPANVTTHLRTSSDSVQIAGPSSLSSSTSTPTSRSISAQLYRKNGQPLKSSLKSRRPIVRGDLSVVTGALSSKSEPSTPTCNKSVHFDAKLEHVKLFLAEQKPLAVSRDGSPTDDTSGTDSDFPSFIYGKEDEKKSKLVLNATNVPIQVSATADVALEKLSLSEDGTNVTGTVRVRNLAFEKWLAVRFTFDNWQTTNEVTAKYVESLTGGEFDRFGFTIRLQDMLNRIEEKTLFLAIRYTVCGREIWDNNSGVNYQVRFRKEKLPSSKTSSTASGESKIADLKNRLEQVAKGQETVGRMLSGGAALRKLVTPSSPDQFTLKSGTPLSSRYDFAASLKSPTWKTRSPLSSEEKACTSSYPNSLPEFPRRPMFERKTASTDPRSLTRGSPRIVDDMEDEELTSPARFYVASDFDDTPVPAMSRKGKARNHQRGYFDLGVGISQGSASNVRRTPPGTPVDASPSLRFNSFPPTSKEVSYRSQPASIPLSWQVSVAGSDDSTPSISSSSASSSSAESSPSESPVELPNFDNMDGLMSPVETSNYNVLLDRFCFFTGSNSMLDVPVESLQRSHSASSVEELLSSPNPGEFVAMTPTRSSSYDDVSSMSGGSTPTAHSVFGSPSPTPVAFVH
ncbi:putative phosphatase regulatory subunit-domain-containing protein [Abortiporus biennis]|nr:putative phosphatase regulatory subunit-domain-containing protein [Abortiporus biennis]